MPDASPTRFAASPTAATSTADKTNPKNQDDHFALWGHNGSHCVTIREDDQNCQGGGTNVTGSADDKGSHNSKGKRNFDFLHSLTSIEQLKKSLQEEEAKDGQHDDKSRLSLASTCTTALTSTCMAKIKESLRQEQQTNNDEEPQQSPIRTALDKPRQKSVHARIHNADRPWKAKNKKKPEAGAQWQPRQEEGGEYRPASLIDQWQINKRSNLQANRSVKNTSIDISATNSKIKRVGASMA